MLKKYYLSNVCFPERFLESYKYTKDSIHNITNLQFRFSVVIIDIFPLESFEASPRFNVILYTYVLQNSYVTDEIVLFFYI